MVFRSALIFLPLVAFAQSPFTQTKASPEVDEALQARVTQMCQYHVEGNFRKAYDLVAEDSKDWYFAAQKNQISTFKIEYIKYNDTFDKAEVQITTQRAWKMRADLPETVVTVPVSTVWKLENGKWFYWQDPVVANTVQLPMGQSSAVAPAAGPVVPAPKLPNLSPDAIRGAAKQILQQASVDKREVTFAHDKAGSEQVRFHNSYPGSVRLVLDKGGKRPTLAIDLDKIDLNAGEDAILTIKYEPPVDNNPTPPVTVWLFVEPFGTRFPISVKVENPASNQ